MPCGKKWNIYGSPSAPRHSKGAFQYDRKDAATVYEAIPANTDILLTHGPPHGTCDMTRKGIHAGCVGLARKMQSPDLLGCRLHLFGHIHEAYGAIIEEATEGVAGGRVSVNAALHSAGQAVIVDLKN